MKMSRSISIHSGAQDEAESTTTNGRSETRLPLTPAFRLGIEGVDNNQGFSPLCWRRPITTFKQNISLHKASLEAKFSEEVRHELPTLSHEFEHTHKKSKKKHKKILTFKTLFFTFIC